MGITPSVSHKPCITYSFSILFSPEFRHLASIWPFTWLTDLLRYLGSSSTTPVQSPASDRTVFPHHHDSHNSATCTPSCVDSQRRHNKYQVRRFGLRQWPQANLAYIDRPIGCAQRVVVRLFSSTEAQSCSTTFSSKTHSVLGDVSS